MRPIGGFDKTHHRFYYHFFNTFALDKLNFHYEILGDSWILDRSDGSHCYDYGELWLHLLACNVLGFAISPRVALLEADDSADKFQESQRGYTRYSTYCGWRNYPDHISDEYYAYCNIPSPIINPIFTVTILVATSLPQFAIEQWFNKRQVQFPQEIEFISDRRKVKVMMSEIAYVESNDSEVWLHLNNGLTHRTKTTISQWSSMLDNGNFIRIHRSYLVNQQAISAHDASFVTILDQRLPISRKYKDSVQQYLASAE